jgi:calcineurin-like phosphoesterase family protein
MGDTYLTGCTHFGHSNIIKFCNRNFQNVHEMDCYLTDIINSKVKQRDRLIFVGDVCFRGQHPREYLKHLHTDHITNVLGNHCKEKQWRDMVGTYGKVKQVEKILDLKYNGYNFVICHFPFRSWAKSHHGSINCYSHVHSQLTPEDVDRGYRAIDVGVDAAPLYGKPFGEPWSLDEIIAEMETRKKALNV